MQDTLCNNHNENIQILNETIKYIREYCGEEIVASEIISRLQQVKNGIRHCKKLGIKMENRLKKYRNNIEKLGFERKY